MTVLSFESGNYRLPCSLGGGNECVLLCVPDNRPSHRGEGLGPVAGCNIGSLTAEVICSRSPYSRVIIATLSTGWNTAAIAILSSAVIPDATVIIIIIHHYCYPKQYHIKRHNCLYTCFMKCLF